jgi:hypothetical protein
MAVIAPKSWRAATLWSIVVVMGEVPSPPSQLIDSFARTVSLEVDTEGNEQLDPPVLPHVWSGRSMGKLEHEPPTCFATDAVAGTVPTLSCRRWASVLLR